MWVACFQIKYIRMINSKIHDVKGDNNMFGRNVHESEPESFKFGSHLLWVPDLRLESKGGVVLTTLFLYMQRSHGLYFIVPQNDLCL